MKNGISKVKILIVKNMSIKCPDGNTCRRNAKNMLLVFSLKAGWMDSGLQKVEENFV